MLNTEYEIRYTPDDWPEDICKSERRAFRKAQKLAEQTGCGPYLIYEVDDEGERYIGAAG